MGWDKRIDVMLDRRPADLRRWFTYSSNCTKPGTTVRLYARGTPNPGQGGYPADTIVFTKPKEFGNWVHMYHIDPNHFWHHFGGRKITLCWVFDNCACGFGPLADQYARVFRTDFEDVGPYPALLPTWRNSYESIRGVLPTRAQATDPRCYETPRDDLVYPEPHIKHVYGWGPKYLRYYGYATGYTTNNPSGHSFCYFKVFDVNLNIRPETWLCYWINPTTDLGRYVGVDLACTNGDTLRATSAKDLYGAYMYPWSGHRIPTGDPPVYVDIPLNQWHFIACHVGNWLAGRTVHRILVPFHFPSRLWGTTGWFEGFIDTIYLGEVPWGTMGAVGPIISTTSS